MSPTWDFYCKKCDKRINDVLCRGNEILCPYCGTKMVKMPAAPALVFRGDGWESNSHKKGDKK